MNKITFLLLALLIVSCGQSNDNPENQDFTTLFEESDGTQTPTYEDVITFYEDLDKSYRSIKTYEVGMTDAGEPLTLITFNPNRSLESEFSDDMNATRVLINNGIHPGESDGIDATMLLMRDLAQGKIAAPENVWVSAIAVYNIGGALNRNSTSRTNQNGPEAYGFRGNARNYDLNRDFVKQDTENARTFAQIYHMIDPDIFVDNHVSNGADYQYTLTHLFTQHNKLGGELGDYLNNTLQPLLEADLKQKGWDITPYVNVFNKVPENGFSQFMDYPRYSTGYTSLWNTIGLMVETHMLKPYKPRVEGTLELMKTVLKIAETEGAMIRKKRKDAFSAFAKAKTYPLAFTLDSTQTTTLNFLGYEGAMTLSEITDKPRLKYDRDQPFTKEVPYYNNYKPDLTVTIPKAYVIPRGYRNIALKLKANDINFNQLKRDTTFTAEVYKIASYNTRKSAYEGHYLHFNTSVEAITQEVTIRKGGYIVALESNKEGLRYLLETLEPAAVDSFFNWNYFDTILQQKEGFSPYVWEDYAQDFLKTHPEIREEFEKKKVNEPPFSNNWYAQLDWIHKKSPYYEDAHLKYPIVRMLD